jgi:hypothetical protein
MSQERAGAESQIRLSLTGHGEFLRLHSSSPIVSSFEYSRVIKFVSLKEDSLFRNDLRDKCHPRTKIQRRNEDIFFENNPLNSFLNKIVLTVPTERETLSALFR